MHAAKTPMQTLSVQSFHNDSPPFTGSTDRNLADPTFFDLHGSRPGSVSPPDLEALNSTISTLGVQSHDYAARPQNSNSVHSRSATPDQFVRVRYRPLSGPSLTSPPGNRDTFSMSGMSSVNGDSANPGQVFEPDAELFTIPRGGSPIDLHHEAQHYTFPRHRLSTSMQDESKTPLVIVACGSFSPPTYLHLRMFEMAKDSIDEGGKYEIVGGYYSPVSDTYKKAGLAPAIHRVRMCELAVDQTSTWLMVDPWEASQPDYQRTAVVLEHFDEHLNGSGGILLQDGSKRKVKIVLLAGGDLIESFGEPGVWSEDDLHIILGRFGCLIVERTGSDVWAFLLSHDILYQHRRNVIVVKQLIYNDISSTKVRLFVRRGMSIKYLLPNSVIQYIHDQNLYRGPDFKPQPEGIDQLS